MIRCAPHLFGVVVEAVSKAILFRDAEKERGARQEIMELSESGREREIAVSTVRETCREHSNHRGVVIDRLLGAGDTSDVGDDFRLISPPRTPRP